VAASADDTLAPLRPYGFPVYGAIPGIVGYVSWDLAEQACRQLPAAPSADEVAARGGLDFDHFTLLLRQAMAAAESATTRSRPSIPSA
jgi:hypothetical protein